MKAHMVNFVPTISGDRNDSAGRPCPRHADAQRVCCVLKAGSSRSKHDSWRWRRRTGATRWPPGRPRACRPVEGPRPTLTPPFGAPAIRPTPSARERRDGAYLPSARPRLHAPPPPEAGKSGYHRRQRPEPAAVQTTRFEPLRSIAMRKRFAFAAGLALAACHRHRLRRGQAQGRLHLRRADRGPRLDLPARPGSPCRRGGVRGQGRDRLRLENVAEGPDAERGDHPPRPRRGRNHLHHLVRLHGPDQQGGQELSGREVRARHRLQARPRQRDDVLRPLLRGPLRHRPDRGADVEERRRGVHSPRSRSRRWSGASTPSCWARSPSTPTSRSRSCG